MTPRVLRGTAAEPDGKAVVGAEVRVGPLMVSTDPDGQFAVRYVEPGDMIVVISPAHHPVPDAQYEGQPDYDITLDPYVARLQVSEESTGRPLGGAAVALAATELGETDPAGVIVLRVSPGSDLQVSVSGYLTATVTYEGDVEPIAVALTPTLLQGVVRDQDSEAPIWPMPSCRSFEVRRRNPSWSAPMIRATMRFRTRRR